MIFFFFFFWGGVHSKEEGNEGMDDVYGQNEIKEKRGMVDG